MSIIKRYPFIRHFQGTPTHFVVHLDRGKARHSGAGAAFWFFPSTSVLSELPVYDQELLATFHAITADHQDVTCQIAVAYRVVDPVGAAVRYDFGIFPMPTTPPQGGEQLSAVIGQLAQTVVLGEVAAMSLEQVTRAGAPTIQAALLEGLGGDGRLAESGVAIVSVNVLGVRPNPEVERALQTPLREELQSAADSALYARRALAVERERAIAENELATKIELARQRQQLVDQEGANARREAEETAAAQLIAQRAQAERTEIDTAARAAQIREVGAAEAAAAEAMMKAQAAAGPEIMRALAMRELAGHLPGIGALTITPDLVTNLLAALGGGRPFAAGLTAAGAGSGAGDHKPPRAEG
ncbi:MAG: hypothetical protein LBG60_05480 [Bifidobacteriaceae bacterium]|jgi:hypothetical protein|nr:hypothetical protein [Bifidobacteriaceae bacterium]